MNLTNIVRDARVRRLEDWRQTLDAERLVKRMEVLEDAMLTWPAQYRPNRSGLRVDMETGEEHPSSTPNFEETVLVMCGWAGSGGSHVAGGFERCPGPHRKLYAKVGE